MASTIIHSFISRMFFLRPVSSSFVRRDREAVKTQQQFFWSPGKWGSKSLFPHSGIAVCLNALSNGVLPWSTTLYSVRFFQDGDKTGIRICIELKIWWQFCEYYKNKKSGFALSLWTDSFGVGLAGSKESIFLLSVDLDPWILCIFVSQINRA